MFLSAMNPNLDLLSSSPFSLRNPIFYRGTKCPGFLKLFFSSPVNHIYVVKPLACVPNSKSFDSNSDANPGINPGFKLETSSQHQKVEVSKNENENPDTVLFPTTIPKKPRRGRQSEAAACEDLVRDSLERTFASIRHLNSETLDEYKGKIIKDRVDEESDSDSSSDEGEDESGNKKEKKVVVEEESLDWPLDADVGWGIRASEYFEQHPIKNVIGEDGVEIDWEGEIDDNWVKEINCLEWESFAFHPSPLVVLVFERYNRATDNWKVLKELEKAIKVYWNAKDRLPPRAVKIDMNIERDLAYALKVRECPQILFLQGNKIIYREKEIRTADELVHMIAHFYYKAKKPSWISDEALIPPF